MFKKTMKFDDLDGEEVTQTFYFNYNKKEIAELIEFGHLSQHPPADGRKRLGLEEALKVLQTPVEESGLTQQENNQQAYDIFQDLILDAYGEKAADNRGFVKNNELRDYWKHHVAFVEMIFEFLENTRLAAEFIENCLPAKVVAQAKQELAAENEGKISSETLAEMVQEADRRQQDPATRIEPGPEAAAEALGESPEIAQLANSVADMGGVPEKKIEDLTENDILEMDDIAFKKLDVKQLSKEQMFAAFKRKSSS